MNSMTAYRQNVLQDLLWLVNSDQHQLAVSLWSDYQRYVAQNCEGCQNDVTGCSFTCGKCMEFALQCNAARAGDDNSPESYVM